jgi:hypothetical protein
MMLDETSGSRINASYMASRGGIVNLAAYCASNGGSELHLSPSATY